MTMATYIILSRILPCALDEPSNIKSMAKKVNSLIKKECPGITWKESYAVKGSWDIVDIIETENEGEVDRAALIIRSVGSAQTETMTTTPWHEFLERL
ncbi:MAG: GYD domain-containing protein [Thermoplasmatota archaeon]